jgi:pilus assembly protein CpaB
MKKKRVIILALQLILVAASIYLMLNFVNDKVEPVEVFIYNTNIENSNQQIGATDIKKIEVPAEAVTKAFVFKKEEALGKYVNGPVEQGQYVYKSQLIGEEEKDIFDEIDLTKLRKISFPVSYEEAFSGEIERGDSIDLLYVGTGVAPEDENGNEEDFTYSKVFMGDVLVYSVTSSDGYKYTPQDNPPQDQEESVELGIITLAVTLEQAEQIQARLNTGQVKFVGRFDESKSYNTLGYVMGNYGKIFSGEAYAETDELKIVEDEFQKVITEE